jgi:N-dimethylarginine dimethylaminohydrolase
LLNVPCETEVFDACWDKDKGAPSGTAGQWSLTKSDLKKWREQYEGMAQAYRDNGVLVHEAIAPTPMIGPYGFSRWIWAITDAAIVLNGGAVQPRAGYMGQIKGREPFYQRVLAELGVPIIYAVRGKGVAEIGGCLWLDDQHFFIEDGPVGNRAGIEQLKPVFAASGAKLVVVHSVGHYRDTEFPAGGTTHPDMYVAIPNIGLAVVAPYMCSFSLIKFLRRIKFDIIEVPVDEYMSGVYNMVNLAPGKVLCPTGAPKTIKAMRDWGIDVIDIPLSEYMKAGGGPHCATLQLIREPGPLVPELQKTPLEELAPDML